MGRNSYSLDKEMFGFLIEEFRHQFKISTSFSDYEKIRGIINEETEEQELDRIARTKLHIKGGKVEGKLSADTIKRAFGIINPKKNGDPQSLKFHVTTCNIIARRLKYRGWDEFCEKANQNYDLTKGFKTIDMYEFSNLIVDRNICIGWYPHKYCMLKYLGDYSFEVVESYNLRSPLKRIFRTIGFRHGKIESKSVYPDIIIEPFHDDDSDFDLIEMGIIPQEYLL